PCSTPAFDVENICRPALQTPASARQMFGFQPTAPCAPEPRPYAMRSGLFSSVAREGGRPKVQCLVRTRNGFALRDRLAAILLSHSRVSETGRPVGRRPSALGDVYRYRFR